MISMVNAWRIRTEADKVIFDIRELSRRQKDLWQRVPYLALQADGRSGYSDNYSRAYREGYWALDASVRSGLYSVYVDLENGKLVNPAVPKKLASDEDVLMLAFSLEQIDARAIVTDLYKRGKEHTWRGYDSGKQEAWRDSMQKAYKLRPDSYKRITYLSDNHRVSYDPHDIAKRMGLES